MWPDGLRQSGGPPKYEDIMLSQADGQVRQVKSTVHWWNARWWPKKVWAILIPSVILAIIVAIAVGVTSINNAYPNYSRVTYKLTETYEGETFFDKFDYFTGYDPTQGFVHYVPASQAKQLNLTYASSTSAVLRVDTSVGPNSVPDASTGRFSVRVTSKSTYSSGLFVFDVLHTPYGCGTWPALWLTDPSNWPAHGEIDVMEATNVALAGNQMTLHTSSGCSMSVKRKQTGVTLQDDCNEAVNSNAGCGVKAASNSTFGEAYNNAGGGVVAMEWRAAGIRVWQFARSAVPADVTGQTPDPSSWGTADADFPSTDCNIGSHFKNNSIILNIDLCGSLVYGVWAQSGCVGNCTDLVANNPGAFTDAYWEINKFQVYQATS